MSFLQREITKLEETKQTHSKACTTPISDYDRGFIDGLQIAINILRNFEEYDMDAMAAHYDQK